MIPSFLPSATVDPLLLADKASTFWFPKRASTFSDNVDWTFDMILWISIAFFVVIVACLFWFAIRFWKKRGEKAESQTSHNTPLELAWSILPSFLLVWMFVQGAISFLDMREPPDGSYEVNVRAYKWGWLFDYGRGVTHPELHIVVNEPTKLVMRSDDVIHSLFVPAFRAKKDVVPGRYNIMWFRATVANEQVSEDKLEEAKAALGSQPWDYDLMQFTPEGYEFFDLYCTEYCGTNHSEMQTAVVVHKTQEDLDAWIKLKSSRGDVPPEDWGRQLYAQRGCIGCHSVDGTRRTGPSFQNLYGFPHPLSNGEEVIADANYIRESILNPKAKIVAGYQPVMPSYQGQLSDDDIDSIIAWMKTLSTYEEPVGEGGDEEASQETAEQNASDEPSDGSQVERTDTEEEPATEPAEQ